MAITLRLVKGSELTHNEADTNFTTLRDVASQTSGTLSGVTVSGTLGAVTLGGAVTGGGQNISGLGSVGIGTTAPGSKLSVSAANSAVVTIPNAISLTSQATAIGDKLGISFSQNSVEDRARAGIFAVAETANGYASSLGFYTRYALDGTTLANTDEKMRILSNGNVGIGTTAPGAPLQVNSATGGAIRLQYTGNSGYGQIETNASSDLVFKTAGGAGTNTRMTILEASGNVSMLGSLTTNGGLQTFGANDSAGAGYRLVRVPNI